MPRQLSGILKSPLPLKSENIRPPLNCNGSALVIVTLSASECASLANTSGAKRYTSAGTWSFPADLLAFPTANTCSSSDRDATNLEPHLVVPKHPFCKCDVCARSMRSCAATRLPPSILE